MTTTPGLEPSADQPNQDRELCHQVLALIPAYALGAADPEEVLLVQKGLARCPEAAAALAGYTGLAEQMLFSAPPVAAPDHLADRLQAALSAQASPAPVRVVPQKRQRSPLNWSWPSPALGFAAMALALLLLIASNFYWNNRFHELARQQAILQRQWQEQTTLVALLRAGHMQRLELATAGDGARPAARAVVMYEPNAPQALLYAEDFPSLAPGQTYQLWLIQGETRTSGGLFQVDAAGYGLLLIDAPQKLGSYDRLGVTPEPAGGSPGPTAPPVVTGAF